MARRLFVEKTPAAAAYKGLAWLFLGVANSDALLYDDEWQVRVSDLFSVNILVVSACYLSEYVAHQRSSDCLVLFLHVAYSVLTYSHVRSITMYIYVSTVNQEGAPRAVPR